MNTSPEITFVFSFEHLSLSIVFLGTTHDAAIMNSLNCNFLSRENLHTIILNWELRGLCKTPWPGLLFASNLKLCIWLNRPRSKCNQMLWNMLALFNHNKQSEIVCWPYRASWYPFKYQEYILK